MLSIFTIELLLQFPIFICGEYSKKLYVIDLYHKGGGGWMTTKLLPVLHTAINTYNCYQFEDLKKSENKSKL